MDHIKYPTRHERSERTSVDSKIHVRKAMITRTISLATGALLALSAIAAYKDGDAQDLRIKSPIYTPGK